MSVPGDHAAAAQVGRPDIDRSQCRWSATHVITDRGRCAVWRGPGLRGQWCSHPRPHLGLWGIGYGVGMTVQASTTLAELVIEDSRRARVLERFGIDYCCNGHRSLSDATAEADLDLDEVSKALDLPAVSADEPTKSAQQADLAHDIIDTHHAYMWEEMPRLQALVEKVYRVHGDRHPELAKVHELFNKALAELDPHMTKEERSVFPAISRLEKTGSLGSFGPLAGQIDDLVQEHTVVGDLFKEINTVTGGYAVPEDACGSYRAMLDGLREMEIDLHEHIHKENYILFPGALELERTAAGN